MHYLNKTILDKEQNQTQDLEKKQELKEIERNIKIRVMTLKTIE